MKILVVCQYYFPEPFRIHEICEELVDQGHSVTVVTTFPNYPEGKIYHEYRNEKKRVENIRGVRVVRYKTMPRHKGIKNLIFNYISFMIIISKKIKDLKNEDFDIIYVYQLSPVFMAIPAIKYKKMKSIPLYLYCLDIWPESIKENISNEKNLLFYMIKLLSSKIYRNADIIGITSPIFKDYLKNVCGVDEKKIQFLPQHAYDIGVCPKTDENGNTEIYFMGNIGKTQNIDLIIEAVGNLKNIDNFTVNFVGSGSELEYAVRKVKKLRLENKIIFHGRYSVEVMPLFYKKADACILSLSNETLSGLTIPGKLQGYMAAGKTILASIDGDTADIINKNRCGIAVPANDVDAFTNALKSYILSRKDYKDCGNNARKYFEEYFTLNKHLKSLTNAFSSMLESH